LARPDAARRPLPVDHTLVTRGAAVYARYCADCHGTSGSDFAGPKVGHVTPIAHIATDPARLDSTRICLNQATLYAGYPHRFRYFRRPGATPLPPTVGCARPITARCPCCAICFRGTPALLCARQ
jgi:hypothetical protein